MSTPTSLPWKDVGRRHGEVENGQHNQAVMDAFLTDNASGIKQKKTKKVNDWKAKENEGSKVCAGEVVQRNMLIMQFDDISAARWRSNQTQSKVDVCVHGEQWRQVVDEKWQAKTVSETILDNCGTLSEPTAKVQ